MPTNYDRYLGTPRKAAWTRIIEYDDPQGYISVVHRNKIVKDLIPKAKFGKWLQEECDG